MQTCQYKYTANVAIGHWLQWFYKVVVVLNAQFGYTMYI